MSKAIFEKNLRTISGFEEIPQNWSTTVVGDLCVIGRGRVISQEEIDRHPGPYPVFSSQTSNKGEMGRIDTFDFDGEWVTWTTDGANAGTVFHRSGQFNCTNVCGTLKPKSINSLDLTFLQYHLGRIAKNYVSYIGNPKLMNEVMGRVAFALPSYPQQRKISRILTTVDNLIEKTESLIAKYQAIKQGMMHDLFTRGVDDNGHLRPPQTEAPDLYKQSELGWIPKGWDEGTIEDYCDIHNHLRFPISSEQREQMQGDYPYYGPTGVFDWLDHYRVEGEYALIGEDGDHFLKYASRPMTILTSGRFNVNNHAHLLVGKNGCGTEWVFAYYCHRDIKNHLTHQGAGRLKLNKSALRAMPLVVPKPAEQKLICERFRSLKARVSTEQTQLNKLRSAKSGLMQDLLSGTVRVKVEQVEEARR